MLALGSQLLLCLFAIQVHNTYALWTDNKPLILSREEAEQRKALMEREGNGAQAGGNSSSSKGESKASSKESSKSGKTVRESGADLAHYGQQRSGTQSSTPGMSQILHTNSYAESTIEGALLCCVVCVMLS